MPVYCPSSSRKPNGFSIEDIIKHDHSPRTSNQTSPSSFLSPLAWLPSSSSLYHFQRESMLQYLRHTHPFPHPGPTAAAFFLHSYRKPKRHRTAFTPTQLLRLENEFEKSHYIVGQERKALAKHLNLPEARVKVWYQNRRTKHKRSINEDGNSSTNDIDHPNESETSETIIKIDDDEQLWHNEENDNHLQLPDRQENSCSD